jgi:hypothetical protein
MSCGCGSDYGSSDGYLGVCDTDTPYPSISHESVPSLIDNLVNALYGSFSKQIDPATGRIVWNVPCTPTTQGIGGITPNAGEGMLCYLARALNELFPDASAFVTLNGIQTLTNKTLASPVFTGSLTLPNASIALSALNGTQNLGLGTTTPSYKLEVTGAGTGYKTSYAATPGNNGAASYFFGGTGGGTFIANSIYLNSSGTLIASNTAGGYIRIGIDGTLQFHNFTGQTVGSTPTTTQRIAVDASGNVGIGTSSPSGGGGGTTLNVKGASAATIRVDNGSAVYDVFAGGQDVFQQNSSATGSMRFRTGASTVDRLIIAADGTINAQGNPITNARYQGTITGITNGANATAGNVGEILSATSSAINLTTNSWANLTSITLTPGDWLVWGGISFAPSTTTSITELIGGINTVNNNWNALPIGNFREFFPAIVPTATRTLVRPISTVRYNVTTNTTIFLNTLAVFTVSLLTASGTITAQRFR